ncbi:MAG: PLP-dependent transferase [Acidobacteria bacterium]|nr:PLP-dependent transferase [Acidobacteriota bacterium]
MKFATKAIHAGQDPEQLTGAVNVPIFLSSTFKQDALGQPRGAYEYARTGNPTRDALEQTLAALENGHAGLCFASGSAATAAVLQLLEPGDEVVSTIDVYGGTYRLFRQVYARYGVRFKFLATSSADEILANTGPETRLIWVESPTNPLLNVIDIQRLAEGRPQGVLLAVDNTFATPAWQTPLDLGADIVVHSVTKYLGGHSDIVGGAVVTRGPELAQPIRFYQNAAGAVPSPFDCFLVQRGIKTLEVRMQRHHANALAIARHLAGHRAVARVFFPGLPDHPHHELAQRQMRGLPGMVSFRVAGGKPAVERFLAALRVFTLAESLGGVESLACYPFTMTHGSIPADDKNRIGITEDLVRLSCGIEDAGDLLEDVEQALAAAAR